MQITSHLKKTKAPSKEQKNFLGILPTRAENEKLKSAFSPKDRD